MEDELWKRFSSARTQFDRHCRRSSRKLDPGAVRRRVKEALIAEAEALSFVRGLVAYLAPTASS